MTRLLKDDGEVSVVLEGNLVRKTVRGYNSSRFCDKVSPEEMVDREVKALGLLEGIDGVQKLIERISPDTIITEYVPGTSLREWNGPLTHEYFDRLTYMTKMFHERGVYRIGDRQRDFLIRPDMSPAIIDFGNVLFKDDCMGYVNSMITSIKINNFLRIKQLRKRFVYKHGIKR